MLTTLVCIGIAATTTGLIQWDRVRDHRRLARMVRQLRDRESDESVVFRPVPEADIDASWLLREARPNEHALEARGLVLLGDVLAQASSGLPHRLSRVLHDPDATTFAYITVSLEEESSPDISLESYSDDECWTTMQYEPPVPTLAQPPFMRVESVSPEQGIDALLAKHRAFAGPGAGRGSSFIRCATLPAICAELTRWHQRTARWRGLQPSDALLEADLRGVLGRHFARLAPRVTRRLAAPLPPARLRRP